MPYYLATTGLAEIWDLDSKLLLLGPWCLASQESKRLVGGKDYTYIQSPWKPTINLKKEADYCYSIYKIILAQLSERLNAIHQVQYPESYWQILFGPWLLHFIEILRDRYLRLEKAFGQFPDTYTTGLSQDQCKLEFFDTADFLAKYEKDYYNLQLFSLICHLIWPEKIKVKNVENQSVNASSGFTKTKVGHKATKRLFYKLLNLFSRHQVTLGHTYHLSPFDKFLFKLRGGWRNYSFVDFFLVKDDLPDNNFSPKLRQNIRLNIVGSEFKELIGKILPKAIPSCFIENYKNYQESIKKIPLAKVVGSAVGWFTNEYFKFYAAQAKSQGAKTFEMQYGGGFGLALSVPLESLALEKDIYYTWGWKSKEKNDKTIPLPNPHLARLKNTYQKKGDELLFISTILPKYHFRNNTLILPEDMSRYLADKKRFFESLAEPIKEQVLYRPYFPDYGWREVETVKKMCPQANFLLKGQLTNWMQKVKLVVIDHAHTSFLEALIINVPCVFYWDHDAFLMRPEAEKYFELLRKVGILYKTPQEASEKINNIFSNPRKWWLSEEVQDARLKFCEHFAYTQKDWQQVWAKEFDKIQVGHK